MRNKLPTSNCHLSISYRLISEKGECLCIYPGGRGVVWRGGKPHTAAREVPDYVFLQLQADYRERHQEHC